MLAGEIIVFIWHLIILFFSYLNYANITEQINKFFDEHVAEKLNVNYPQLIHTTKWKFDYIVVRKKKWVKKLDNHFVPKYIPNDLPWYERDGLMTWYDQVQCQQFLEDTDKHFQNLKIINFDMIHSKGKLTVNCKSSWNFDLSTRFGRWNSVLNVLNKTWWYVY